MNCVHKAYNRSGIKKWKSGGRYRKKAVERLASIGLLKFIREISLWESILLGGRLEIKERLEYFDCGHQDWIDEVFEEQENNHAEDEEY